MYGLAGYKNTPGMPDMNKKLMRIMSKQPGSYGRRRKNGKVQEKPTRHA